MEFESNLQNAYLDSYTKGCAALRARMSAQVCADAGVPFDAPSDCFTLRYLANDYRVGHQSGEIVGVTREATGAEKALMVHYLVTAHFAPKTGNPITFKELPGGGAIYCSNFQKRAIDPIVKTFCGKPELFYKAASALGGTKQRYGHASIELQLFPHVNAIYVVWEGDEEIPGAGNIFFDTTVTRYLPVEDIVVAASFGSYDLIKKAYEG